MHARQMLNADAQVMAGANGRCFTNMHVWQMLMADAACISGRQCCDEAQLDSDPPGQ